MESRFLLTRRGCPFCNQAIKVINRINPKLPIDKRIRIVDCANWEDFGVRDIPLMDIFDKLGLNDGYPFLYIDGIVIEPAPTQEILKTLLLSMLKEDLII